VRQIRLAVVITALLGAGSASAAGVGLRVGTTGIGGDVAFDLVPTLSARFGYSWLNFNTTVDSSDVTYDGKLKLSNGNVFLDWAPIGPLFRGTYTLGGVVYPAAAIGSLSGTVKAGTSAAPYLGIGTGRVAGAGVNFYADLGVMFQGTPKATLTATCGPATPVALCSQIQASTALEAIDLQDSIKNFKYYPVANIGVTIGF
jgi:hypothetical protein